jgi:hypothetical protein
MYNAVARTRLAGSEEEKHDSSAFISIGLKVAMMCTEHTVAMLLLHAPNKRLYTTK